ncbi:MAG: putative phage abortive infection protein [Bacteroidales bacterium]
MSFYIKYKSKLSICYRTLYRLYNLIDESKTIDENTKKNYLKIARAQYTESELFFIRYNAMSFYGEKFITYINKYNILKHLPILNLLEFKEWWQFLDNDERTSINIILYLIEKKITEKLKSNTNNDVITKLPISENTLSK